MLDFFLDFLFPKRCVHCGTVGSYICLSCKAKIKPLLSTICPMCERPAIGGITHPVCDTRYSLDGLVSFYRYDGPIRASVKRLKYKPYISDLVALLTQHVTSNTLTRNDFKDFVVVAVPLHPQRERERGFNQASLIGKAVAKRLALEFNDNVLKRTRYTKPQVALKEKERRKNLADAFALSPNILVSQYPNILLIDDVWTTGSTMRVCGNVLKRGGAKKVWALTLAR